MPAARYIPSINTLDQKLQIQRRLGGLKSCKYFNLLTRYLNMKVTKSDFDRLCIGIIGRENVPLHNHFLKSILKKACLSKAAPPRQSVAEGSLKVKIPNGCNGLPPLGKNSRKCRTPNLRDRRFRDRPSPFGPHGKNSSVGFENSSPKIQEHQMDVDVHPVGNSLRVSVEHREEVNHDSERLSINRRSPIRSPLGPHGKNNIIGFENSTPKSQEHQMDTHLHPVGNGFHVSVEHREEVNRDSERLAINRRAPLGPHEKNNSTGFENSTPKSQEHQMDTHLHPVGNGFHVSVEHRVEVNRDSERMAINRRSPIRSPLGPHGKNNVIGSENSTPKSQEHQMDTHLHPVGNGFHVSVEHREEVNQDSERLAINRTTHIQEPLGPHVKNYSTGFENSTPKPQEHQMDTHLHPVGNGFHVPVEHRVEVNRDSEGLVMNRRTPIRAPLGPHVMNNSTGFENSTPKFQEHQMVTDLHPVRNGFHVSVEHREEVNRDSERLAINRRTPIRAPFGPHGKNNSTGFENSAPKFQEHQVDTDLHPVGNGFYVSKQHREEVNQDSERLAINRRTPIRAPLGPHVMNNSTGFENSTPKFQEHQMDTDQHPVRNGFHVSVEHRKDAIQDSAMLPMNRSAPMRAPLGPHVMNNSTGFENSTLTFQEHQMDTDLHPVRNGFHVPVEHRKEVIPDSAMLAMNRAPIRAPLGLPTYDNRAQMFTHQGLQSGIVTDTCQSIGHLPDTYSLMKRMERNFETEGCKISADAANVMNTALDVFLKRLIKPCLGTAASVNNFRGQIQPGMNELPRNRRVQKPIGSASASISDFRTAMELNPTLLGEDWPLHFERTCFRAFEK